MNKLALNLFFLLSSMLLGASKDDTLFINYFQNIPFAYEEKNAIRGIEIDIMNEYVLWLKTTKKMNVYLKYNSFTDFDNFYNTIKKSTKQTFGLGGLTINAERKKEVDFTAAYLKNVAFCITNGNAMDLKVKSSNEIIKVFGNMTALTIQNSSLNQYLNELKKSYLPELKITFEANPEKILNEISKNILYFGYVDAVSFWIYLKSNPGKFLRMQKILNQSKEELGIISTKGNPHIALFNEFFNGNNAFKQSKAYRALLEKYLGAYMTQNMAIN